MIPEMVEVFMKVFLQRVDIKYYIWQSFLLILYLPVVHFSFNSFRGFLPFHMFIF